MKNSKPKKGKTNFNDPAKRVFDMLGFQFKPMEERFLQFCKEQKAQDLIDGYKKASYAEKIYVLDTYAQHLGI